MKRRQLVTSVLATSLVALCSGSPAWAVDSQPFRTGLFGVTARQTIRVSVVNARMQKVLPVVRIRDLAGTPLFEWKSDSLLEGMGTFVDIPWEDAAVTLTRTRRARTQVRAEVVFEFDDTLLQRGDVLLTLEVFDTLTGRTMFTVAFNPQPEPPEPIRTPGS